MYITSYEAVRCNVLPKQSMNHSK